MSLSADLSSDDLKDRLRDPHQLQRVLAEVIVAHDLERGRLAAEIHDGVVQAMTAAGLRLGQLRRHLDDPTRVEELLSTAEEALAEASRQLRELMAGLQPGQPGAPGRRTSIRSALDQLGEERQ